MRKVILALFLLLLLAVYASDRLDLTSTSVAGEKVVGSSDLIVIALPIKAELLSETNMVNDLKWQPMQTTFQISTILKGAPERKEIVTTHYVVVKGEKPSGFRGLGGGFEFEIVPPKADSGDFCALEQGPEYLLFLQKRPDPAMREGGKESFTLLSIYRLEGPCLAMTKMGNEGNGRATKSKQSTKTTEESTAMRRRDGPRQ